MITKNFPKQTMVDILWGEEGKIISDEIEDTSRWSIHHRLIFEFEDEFWQAYYSVGATEQQDEQPWEYEDEVQCTKVEPVEETVIVYKPVQE